MSLVKVLGVVAGAVGIAAVAKWAMSDEKKGPFTPVGWVLVNPTAIDDIGTPPDASSLPIGTVVLVVLAKTDALPTTKEALRATPMIVMEMLIIGSSSGTYDLSVQQGFEGNTAAEKIGLRPPPQGQVFSKIPAMYVAKVVSRPGETSAASLVPPPVPQPKPKEGFVQSSTGTAYVGRAGDWIYGVETNSVGDYDVVWAHAALNGQALIGARRNGTFYGYKTVDVNGGPTAGGTIRIDDPNSIWLIASKGAIGFKSSVIFNLANITVEGQNAAIPSSADGGMAFGILDEQLRDMIKEQFPTLPLLV